jgi:hypothetical protein
MIGLIVIPCAMLIALIAATHFSIQPPKETRNEAP